MDAQQWVILAIGFAVSFFVAWAVVAWFMAWVRRRGAEIESEPQEYTYLPGYYAVFFYDPDGLKLEIVHVPGLFAA